MSDDFDPFKPSEGSDLEDYTAVVKASVFEVDEDYDPDTLLLRWDMEITGPDDFPFETRRLSFTCGKKFESPDGGKTATHIDGKPKGFHPTSRMGMLVHRAFHDPDSADDPPMRNGEPLEPFGLKDHFISQNKTPFDSDGWVGLEFKIGKETIDYGGEIGKRSIEMPYEVVASAAPKPAAKKTAAKKGTAKKAAGRKRAAAKEPEPLNVDAVKEALLDAGEEAEDYADFMKMTAAVLGDLVPADHPELPGIMDWLEDEDGGAWSEYEEVE